MEELKLSDTKYEWKDNGWCIEIVAQTDSVESVIVEDICFDEVNENYIFAVKCYEAVDMYYIDYIILNRSLEIIKVMKENAGVNPNFIISPSGEVWVSLSAICLSREGEIVLPLENRSRINKEIVKAELGFFYYFRFCNNFYGYFLDVFYDKGDKLGIYVFDGKDMYKTRKMVKLEENGGKPAVLKTGESEKCYLCFGEYNDDESKIRVRLANIDEQGCVIDNYYTEYYGNIDEFYPVRISDQEYQFVCAAGNRIKCVAFDKAGKMTKEKVIYTIPDVEIYTFDCVINNDKVICAYNSEQKRGILVLDDEQIITEMLWSEEGILINHEHMIETNRGYRYAILKSRERQNVVISDIGSANKKILIIQ